MKKKKLSGLKAGDYVIVADAPEGYKGMTGYLTEVWENGDEFALFKPDIPVDPEKYWVNSKGELKFWASRFKKIGTPMERWLNGKKV